MTEIQEFAPAKLNLYLHVLGRDARGYHLLDSLVAFADIGDTLMVMPSETLSLTITGPFSSSLESDSGNLVWKAATALAGAFGRSPNVAVRLVKTLPVASGIGGGSSDAAAMLRALCRLWRIDPDDPRVMQVARSLGSDVPVCLAAEACFMGGTGEILTPCQPLPAAHLVLVNPGVAVPTKAVFAARQGDFTAPQPFADCPSDAAGLAASLKPQANDLTDAAMTLAPVIGTVLEILERTDGCLLARMLGSGATCFGLFADAATAQAARLGIEQAYPAWWTTACRLQDLPCKGA